MEETLDVKGADGTSHGNRPPLPEPSQRIKIYCITESFGRGMQSIIFFSPDVVTEAEKINALPKGTQHTDKLSEMYASRITNL